MSASVYQSNLISKKLELVPVGSLSPHARNARTHSKRQIRQIAESIKRFGFTNPILTDDAGQIIAGHGRLEAAKLLAIAEVPTIRLSHLSDVEKRAYIIADNRLAEAAGWDRDILAIELQSLLELDVEITLTGFDTGEIDILLDEKAVADTSKDDVLPALPKEENTVSRYGDIWICGAHRLICGNALDISAYGLLLDGELAEMVFADPPYNLKIDGHVSGLGKVRHPDFVMASGEMSNGQFMEFLQTAFRVR